MHENILFYFPKFGKNRNNIVVVVVDDGDADNGKQGSRGSNIPSQ